MAHGTIGAVSDAVTEPERARFLGLCASSRYAEAEPLVGLVYANGSTPDGSEILACAGFYEDWGDAVAAIDPDVARTAYAQAEDFYVLHASWSAAPVDDRLGGVARIGAKLAALAAR